MNKNFKIIVVSLCVFYASSLYAGESNEMKKASDKKHYVFAHYMTCFYSTVDFYKREIELAQRYGIDGFALNCGSWLKPDGKGNYKETNYVYAANRMFQAAKELGTNFKLFMSPDYACSLKNHSVAYVSDMLKRYYKHPNLFRYKGKAVLSGYGASPKKYIPAISKLRENGYEFYFVPAINNKRYAMAWSMETVLGFFRDNPSLDGIFNFSCDDTVQNIIQENATARRGTIFEDKIYMAGTCPAYNSPNLRDYRGVRGYSLIWDSLIKDSADWVEIVTWNDYAEDSNLMPFHWYGSSGKTITSKEYFNRDESYLDITKYYAEYFKTGIEPKITQDKIYFTYRVRSKYQTKVWDKKIKKWDDVRFASYPYDQLHDDVKDLIYVTSFLKDKATLEIKVGRISKIYKLDKGISYSEFPHQAGVPQFILSRSKKELINVFGRKQIISEITKENSVKGYHLANRTWTSGAVAGPVLKQFKASQGELFGEAKLEKNSVRLGAKKTSGLSFAVTGLKTALYNFRITYNNPSKTEARLTMKADGVPMADNTVPYYIPLFLPPTDGEFKTVSLLWSLYGKTTALEIVSEKSTDKNLIKRGHNDIGVVQIKSVALIEVKPFAAFENKAQGYRQLIKIAGGAFKMGQNNTEPDEAPVHNVKISPFAIGKYEVTNEEFEKFMPEHRKFRDGYSWRNKEPVIYVSWLEAAKYCNWLSRKHNLRPVYNEKDWSLDIAADGFRLPTEAEWEYVASGRGESRIYPWGNNEPNSKHGNFTLNEGLTLSSNYLSPSSDSVMFVGSYPKGASRDGVMDLAGNVAEWCSDYYNPYSTNPQVDPCSLKKSYHRAIRGGSWGYYNYSQRCSDREFNNAGYSGYIYIGFRIVLPESGIKKLKLFHKK